MKTLFSGMIALLLCAAPAQAQNAQDDIHLFLHFLPDAAVASSGYLNGGLGYASYRFVSRTTLGGSVHIPFTPRFEGAASIQYVSIDPDFGRNRDGISDLLIHAKYHLPAQRVQATLGGFVTLPVGSEDIGAGDDITLGFFAAWRYPLAPRTALAATTGLHFLPRGDDYDLALQLGGGIIHRAGPRLGIVGELYIRTVTDDVVLGGGVDYAVSPQGRLRAGLGLGLSDESPDYSLALSFLHRFRP